MANELRGVSTSGNTLYARIMNPAGLWWNGSAFEAYSAGNYATYDVALTEQGSSGVYVGTFPAGITTAGTYEYYVYIQSGGSPAESDVLASTGRVDWTGTASSVAAAGSMTGSDFYAYLLRRGFKRTDKATEVYEAITDAIQMFRRRFGFSEAHIDTLTTDTISVAGDYKIDIESDLGMLIGVRLEDGTSGRKLKKIAKSQFEDMYPDIDADTNDTGYPEHFCVFGEQILIGPRPDSTSYQYRVSYSQSGGTVVSSTASVPFTGLYRDVLADLVYSLLYYGLDEPALGDSFRLRFEAEFPLAVRQERKNSGEGSFCAVYRDI